MNINKDDAVMGTLAKVLVLNGVMIGTYVFVFGLLDKLSPIEAAGMLAVAIGGICLLLRTLKPMRKKIKDEAVDTLRGGR